jgi:hypothetical protein
VDSGDYAPAQQARAVFAELSDQLDNATSQFEAAVRSYGPELSRQVTQAVTQGALVTA